MNSLGDLERRIMEAVWAADGPISVREVHGRIGEDRELAYTTVMTVLDRLAKKGLLLRERDGRAYRYTPAQSRDELVAGAMHTALEGDAADRNAALVAFVGRVSADEAEALRDALARLEAGDRSTPG